MTSADTMRTILRDNTAGGTKGVYSVCSSHSSALVAAFRQAKRDGSVTLVESTSNQVDQNGGYTGMRPEDFVRYVRNVANAEGFPTENILLGGDHLGPNAWSGLCAQDAMANAKVLVSCYVNAGYQKIHLDASMYCLDDKGDRSQPLDDEIVSEREAELCKIAENAWRQKPGGPAPLYVVGTEVPVPGGAKSNGETVNITPVKKAETTLQVTRETFMKRGLQEAWDRVIAIVVQPGVEFSDDTVIAYDSGKARELSTLAREMGGRVFEAHSTDYQSEKALANMVQDHFCILKVGPWLTFAYREALFALSLIEEELAPVYGFSCSQLRHVIESVLVRNPKYWEKYYQGTEAQTCFQRKYSLSDRVRYYWTSADIASAIDTLFKNLGMRSCPMSLLSQYLPGEYRAVREGEISPDPQDLIVHHVMAVTGTYAKACRMSS